jgi:hypothetical protein
MAGKGTLIPARGFSVEYVLDFDLTILSGDHPGTARLTYMGEEQPHIGMPACTR